MANIRLDHGGMEELLKSHDVEVLLQRIAGPVEAACIASAPVETGAHRDSIHTETVRTDRVKVRVVADSDHSLLVEAKTGHMARSLRAAAGIVE